MALEELGEDRLKHLRVVQGSEEWKAARCGIPTASEFHRIIQPKKWELAAGRASYAIELLTERLLGMPLDTVTTAAMETGKATEPKARAAYEALHGVDVEEAGFCTVDDGSCGCSPDGFPGPDGLVEFKSPDKPQIHVGYFINREAFHNEHFVQAQGQLYVCSDRSWCDLVSYWPTLPMVTVRIERHMEFQMKLDRALKTFLAELTDLCELAKKRGAKFPQPPGVMDHSHDWVTQEDVDFILAGRRPNG